MRWNCCRILVLGLLFLGTPLALLAKGPEFIDIAEAGKDYVIQGEYSGSMSARDAEGTKVGVQIVALGEGKFVAVGFLGGLPGEGARGKVFAGQQVTAALNESGTLELPMLFGKAVVDGKTLTVVGAGNQTLFTLNKVERKSPTLGAKPPQGAVVLFDGSGADAFENGRVTSDGLLMVGTKTKQTFKDFTLHVEFRTPFMPADLGQARGNSGIYLQERYELQVLDSFGLQGLNNEAGGFYQARDPNANMCFPPLAWQTYDIEFTAARFEGDNRSSKAKVTVRHNGVIVHDGFEFENPTPGGQPEAAAPLGLSFQDHGNQVHYRNIWILEK